MRRHPFNIIKYIYLLIHHIDSLLIYTISAYR